MMDKTATDILKLAREVAAAVIPAGADGYDLYKFINAWPKSERRGLEIHSDEYYDHMVSSLGSASLYQGKRVGVVLKVLQEWGIEKKDLDRLIKMFNKAHPYDPQEEITKKVVDAMERFGLAMGSRHNVTVENGGMVVSTAYRSGLPKYSDEFDEDDYESMVYDELDDAEKEFDIQFSKLMQHVKKHEFQMGDKKWIHLIVKLKR